MTDFCRLGVCIRYVDLGPDLRSLPFALTYADGVWKVCPRSLGVILGRLSRLSG